MTEQQKPVEPKEPEKQASPPADVHAPEPYKAELKPPPVPESLQQQIDEAAKAHKGSAPFDVDALLRAVAEITNKNAVAAAETAIAPLKAKEALRDTAAALGLTVTQAQAVIDLRAKNPGLNDQQALWLLRQEKPDIFPRQRQEPIALPTSGPSPLRDANPEPDYATAIKDIAGTEAGIKLSEHELLRRIGMAHRSVGR